MIKDLFRRIKEHQVVIKVKPYGDTSIIEYKGRVVANYYSTEKEMFIELDNGELINTTYIISIKISQ